MNADRPVISPGLLASLLEAAPAGVRRRIEAEPDLAAAWDWTAGDEGW